ncbi:translocator protein [Spiroplasma endosymbiont of Stenodema calcarata]|uniref:translocator protein n=1 Tax=Spiroplasma endosymbiont of Stenodema calcarata TaxID=3139328 RepID=UPI003CCA862F
MGVVGYINAKDMTVQKVELNRENLILFFQTYNIFKYKGDFFFKDAMAQTLAETKRMTPTRINNMFKSLLDQTLGQKIRKYFIYNPSSYLFEIDDLTHFNCFKFETLYHLTFRFKLTSLKDDFIFIQDDLSLQFTETKQYDKERWLKIYLDYLKNWGNFLWTKKYSDFENNGHLPHRPFAEWTIAEDKKEFTKNNSPVILDFLSKHYTNLFSNQGIKQDLWLYEDKQFEVQVTSYQYLGVAPPGISGEPRLRALVTLVFTNLDDKKITASQNYELWMEYKQIKS